MTSNEVEPIHISIDEYIAGVRDAGARFIIEDTKWPWPNEKTTRTYCASVAAFGSALVLYGAADVALTASAKAKYDVDQFRTESASRFEKVGQSIGNDLGRHPDETSLCIEEAGDVCLQLETYDVSSEEGVVRFVTDTLDRSFVIGGDSEQLTATEMSVAEQGLQGLDAEGGRTPDFDAEVLNAIEEASTEYVATLPDFPEHTTNEHTGETMLLGGGIIALSAIAMVGIKAMRKRARGRLMKKWKEYDHEKTALWTQADELLRTDRGMAEIHVPIIGLRISDSNGQIPDYDFRVQNQRKGGGRVIRKDRLSQLDRLVNESREGVQRIQKRQKVS